MRNFLALVLYTVTGIVAVQSLIFIGRILGVH